MSDGIDTPFLVNIKMFALSHTASGGLLSMILVIYGRYNDGQKHTIATKYNSHIRINFLCQFLVFVNELLSLYIHISELAEMYLNFYFWHLRWIFDRKSN